MPLETHEASFSRSFRCYWWLLALFSKCNNWRRVQRRRVEAQFTSDAVLYCWSQNNLVQVVDSVLTYSAWMTRPRSIWAFSHENPPTYRVLKFWGMLRVPTCTSGYTTEKFLSQEFFSTSRQLILPSSHDPPHDRSHDHGYSWARAWSFTWLWARYTTSHDRAHDSGTMEPAQTQLSPGQVQLLSVELSMT